MVNTTTIGINVPPVSVPQPAPKTAANAPAPASSDSSPDHDKSAKHAHETFGSGVDEHTLDRMALRLMKRDPGLAIEKDSVLRRYIYRFLDSESGDLVRQFPAERVLATMRALRVASEGRIASEGAEADLEA